MTTRMNVVATVAATSFWKRVIVLRVDRVDVVDTRRRRPGRADAGILPRACSHAILREAPLTPRRPATMAPMRHDGPRSIALVLLAALAIGVGACTVASSGSSRSSALSIPVAGASSGARPTRIPILIDAEDAVGPARFLFALGDQQNAPIGAPDLPATVAFYDLAKSSTTPTATVNATFIWAIQGQRGIYVADTTFNEAGDWAAAFTTTKAGLTETTRVQFQVVAKSSTPAVGAKAPDTLTPTLADVGGDVAKISTDTTPDPAFYQTSVHDALAAHKPFVLVFATPAFCTSRQCGPTLDAIKALSKTEPAMTFINVEPYKLQFVGGHLQPILDANGQLQATDATNAWGLLTEPWIFVVDGSGIVRGSFALIASDAELKAAIAVALRTP
ncbi:MAG: hypothetical protein ACYDAK_11220 [Candidatus Limnocylindrales bacterium]